MTTLAFSRNPAHTKNYYIIRVSYRYADKWNIGLYSNEFIVQFSFLHIESETSNVESASNPTKSLRRCGRAQKGSSDLITGTMCIDCTLLYMYTNLACIESETSNVESASNPTKPLRRCGRAQKGSSDMVAGRLLIVPLCTCLLHCFVFLLCCVALPCLSME